MSLLTPPTELTLAERAISGDRLALEELIRLHQHRVIAVCRARLRRPEDVDDAVQETFIRALKYVHQLRDPESFGPWLRTIAGRVCVDIARDRSRRHASVLEDTAIDAGARPDEAMEVAEEQRRVHAALQGLGERDRQALWLRHGVEAPISQIAEELGVTEGSARVLLTRARIRLREVASGMAAVIPLPWRRWARTQLDHLAERPDIAVTFGNLAMAAGLVLLPMVGAPASTNPSEAPARPVVTESHVAGLDRVHVADDEVPATVDRHHHAPTSAVAPAESPDEVDRPGPIGRIVNDIEIKDEYPEDQEYVVEFQVFAADGDEGNTVRLYGDPLEDPGATVEDTVGGLVGE